MSRKFVTECVGIMLPPPVLTSLVTPSPLPLRSVLKPAGLTHADLIFTPRGDLRPRLNARANAREPALGIANVCRNAELETDA